jgi:PBP1b-binding outer membrane lipoprotein LpoB
MKKLAMLFVVGFGLMLTGCPQETTKPKVDSKKVEKKTTEEKTTTEKKSPEEKAPEAPKAPEKDAK